MAVSCPYCTQTYEDAADMLGHATWSHAGDYATKIQSSRSKKSPYLGWWCIWCASHITSSYEPEHRELIALHLSSCLEYRKARLCGDPRVHFNAHRVAEILEDQ